MSGLGAWSFGYYKEGMAVPNSRVAAGIIAFKTATIDNGFKDKVELNPVFGANFKEQVIAFQTNEGIAADGVIGPETARYLFRYHSYPVEMTGTIEIPNHLLQRLGAHESGHDPVAQGYADPNDEGWAQISLTNHPKITQQQAWTPSFAIPWAGNDLKAFYVNEYADWDGALASYNIGSYYAKMWVEAGKPSSGKWVNGIDYYARAYQYVAGVKSMPV